jgi:hypothetical protein
LPVTPTAFNVLNPTPAVSPLTTIVLYRRQKIIVYSVVILCCLVVVMALTAEKRSSYIEDVAAKRLKDYENTSGVHVYLLVNGGDDLAYLGGLGLLAQPLHGEVEIEPVHVQPPRHAHELAEQPHALRVLHTLMTLS